MNALFAKGDGKDGGLNGFAATSSVEIRGQKMMQMEQSNRWGLSASQEQELWERWERGQSSVPVRQWVLTVPRRLSRADARGASARPRLALAHARWAARQPGLPPPGRPLPAPGPPIMRCVVTERRRAGRRAGEMASRDEHRKPSLTASIFRDLHAERVPPRCQFSRYVVGWMVAHRQSKHSTGEVRPTPKPAPLTQPCPPLVSSPRSRRLLIVSKHPSTRSVQRR
jgi:hypothetical protein